MTLSLRSLLPGLLPALAVQAVPATLAVGLAGCSSSSGSPGQPQEAGITVTYQDDSGTPCPNEVNGHCLVTLAHEQDSPVAIAAASGNVFWASSYSMGPNGMYGTGGIRKVPVDGGIATTLASGNLPSAIALDSTNVYWTDVVADDAGAPVKDDAGAYVRGVFAVPAAGGATTMLASGTGQPLAADSANVYVTVADSLVRVPNTGGAATTLASAPAATNIAVDSQNVYWLAQGSSTDILSVPIAGGSVTTLATSPTSGKGSFAVGATGVFFSCEPWGYAITKVALGGGTVTTVAAAGNATALALDSTSVYWVDGANVMKVALSGGAVTTLAPANAAVSLAVDATGVYWTVANAGDIVKMTPK
jgi:hypothetical protein